MYIIGDFVIYGKNGVCKIEAIETPDVPWLDKSKCYYKLCPLYKEGNIYIPVDTEVFMRPVIKKKEALKLIALIPSFEDNVYDSRYPKHLEEHYNKSLETHDCGDLIRLIKVIYTKNIIAKEQGRKLGQTDERFKKIAEDLLYGEFAIALDITKMNVRSFIEEKIKELKH